MHYNHVVISVYIIIKTLCGSIDEADSFAQVVLFLNAADVDKTRLQRLLSVGVEIEYHGRKVLEATTFRNNLHPLL